MSLPPNEVSLRSADAAVHITPGTGGRIRSFTVAGHELLLDGDPHGSFPMVPWCGRLRDGVLHHAGRSYPFPRDAPRHALHGLGWTRAWTVTASTETTAELSLDLGASWPFAGTATQRISIDDHGLDLEMTISTAAVDFPAQAGWHPWFRRTLYAGDAPVRIDFAAAWQEVRGADYLPTGERIAPRPGPWDDCFGMPDGVKVTLTWPDRLELRITSPVQWLVVYDERPEGVCIEPQSGPPDGLNTLPHSVTPAAPLCVRSRWGWHVHG